MTVLLVDGLKFAFRDDWQVSKYDEWSFYRNQFIKQGDGIKAVDIVALSHQNDAFLIEVKDYRHPDAGKPSELAQVVAAKVLHTLAALLPAKLYAKEPSERNLAAALLQCRELKIVLHIEQKSGSRQAVDLADLKKQIRALLRAVDAHPKIVSMGNLAESGLAWSVG